jgi:hypothetical protein
MMHRLAKKFLTNGSVAGLANASVIHLFDLGSNLT